ncbi:selenoprotein M-like [Sitophilus oryzae]|uniref:Selenoprotein M n=1 Tax=Sitophilus oryzae TaxID=7048 RepID=A0A6J2XF68_SITOR|nr:selenoprotein M-like [Sitophilus oryzae]
MKAYLVSVLFVLIIHSSTSDQSKSIVRARVDSCAGCQLNRLAEVRAFIYEDIPKYENVEWKKIQGHPPELIFFNEADEEVERHLLEKLNRQACNKLLEKRGFKLKDSNEIGKEL